MTRVLEARGFAAKRDRRGTVRLRKSRRLVVKKKKLSEDSLQGRRPLGNRSLLVSTIWVDHLTPLDSL